MPLLAAFLLAAPVAAHLSHGTAIAAIRTPSELVIAADSRVVDEHGRRLPDTCKVRIVDDTVFAIHGMSAHPAGLDLFALVTDVVAFAPDLRTASGGVVSRATGPIRAAVSDLRSSAPRTFERYVAGKAPAGVLLARIEHGRPAISYIRFSVSDAAGSFSIRAEVRSCPGADCPTGVTAIFVGPAEDVSDFKASHPGYWTRDPSSIASAFVRREVSHRHDDIGGPVQVLRLRSSGVAWLSRKPPCP